MVIEPTPPRIHLREAFATWWRMSLLIGSLFAVLFSAGMAAVDGETFLEFFWPLGALSGVLAGASMGLYLLQVEPPVSVTIPLLPLSEALETLTQAARNCGHGYVLLSSTPTSARFRPRRTLFGFTVQPFRAESTGDGGLRIIGPKTIVTKIASAAADRNACR